MNRRGFCIFLLPRFLVLFIFICFKNVKAEPFGIYSTPKSLALAGNLVAHGLGSNALFENPAGLVYPFFVEKFEKSDKDNFIDVSILSINFGEDGIAGSFFKSSFSVPVVMGGGFSWGSTELGVFSGGFAKNVVKSKFFNLSTGVTVGWGSDNPEYESGNSTFPWAIGLKAHFFGNQKFTLDFGAVYKRKSIADYWENILISSFRLNSWGVYEPAITEVMDVAQSYYLNEYACGISFTFLSTNGVFIGEVDSGKSLLGDVIEKPFTDIGDLTFFGYGLEFQLKGMGIRHGIRVYVDEEGNSVLKEIGGGIAISTEAWKKFIGALKKNTSVNSKKTPVRFEISFLSKSYSFPQELYFEDEGGFLRKIDTELVLGIGLGGSF